MDSRLLAAQVAAALSEDLGAAGDRTAALVPEKRHLNCRVITRQPGVLAGREWFDAVFARLDPSIRVTWRKRDGDALEAEDELCELAGPAQAILTGERTALNFLQLLSGTATRTRRYVDAVRDSGVRILDTRKTVPGLRMAQKYAVRCGGGENHRMGLYDAVLIKENHLAATGGIGPAVDRSRTLYPDLAVEVEVETLEELDEAVAAGADQALLDNFSLADLRRAARRHRDAIVLEASGNITLANVAGVAATGVHCISIGDLTKTVEPLDLSMRHT